MDASTNTSLMMKIAMSRNADDFPMNSVPNTMCETYITKSDDFCCIVINRARRTSEIGTAIQLHSIIRIVKQQSRLSNLIDTRFLNKCTCAIQNISTPNEKLNSIAMSP